MNLKVGMLCFAVMVAFAANSVLCRMALKGAAISPLAFTSVRLISGSIVLLPILFFKKDQYQLGFFESFRKGLPLFTYALFFSLAYIKMGAGVGALILFAAVQITMIGLSFIMGNRLNKIEWIGFVMAFGGVIYLLFPGMSAPPLVSAIFMLISGISWGLYSILGKGAKDPIVATASNFLFCFPLSLILLFIVRSEIDLSGEGFVLACISGAVASGPGYVLWYIVLRKISTTIASIIQLSVPILAALGGVLFISESLNLRLVASTIVIFGGILLTIKGKKSS